MREEGVSGGTATCRGRGAAAILAFSAMLFAACFEAKPPMVLEFAEVVEAGTAGALAVSKFDGTPGDVHVLEPTRFRIATASVASKKIDPPMVMYQLTPQDAIRFREWTTARVKRPVALMLDRRVVQVANIAEPLPGGGHIEFGPSGPDRGDLWEICDRLRPRD